jgi:hypothetical protein
VGLSAHPCCGSFTGFLAGVGAADRLAALPHLSLTSIVVGRDA